MKKMIACIGIFLASQCPAQEYPEIEKPVRDLFRAMAEADPELMQSAFTETALLQTVTGKGVKTEDLATFISSVSSYARGDLEERIRIEALHTDGSLASVFVPYSFYFKGKFSHCGTNSVQLVKQDGIWKIQYLIDTRRKDNCKEIK